MLSQGVPLLLSGDEMGRSQQGNNNAYCQNNEINHLDWSLLEKESEFFDFVCRLIKLRQDEPLLRHRQFVHMPEITADDTARETVQIQWLDPAGETMSSEQWGESFARCVGLLLTDSQMRRRLFMIFNASREAIDYSIPEVTSDEQWQCKLNTAETLASEAVPQDALAGVVMNDKVTVAASSVVVCACNTRKISRSH